MNPILDGGVTTIVVVAGCGIALCAGVVGGLLGFASSLVSLPLYLFLGISPATIVVVNLVMVLASRLVVLALRIGDVDMMPTSILMLGGLPGVGFGLLLRPYAHGPIFNVGAGTACVAAALLLSARWRPKTQRASILLAAGWISGLLGITSSLNGAPPAIVLRSAAVRNKAFVADMSLYLVTLDTATLLTLALVGGGISPSSTHLLLWWVPPGLAGTWLGLRLGSHLTDSRFRRIVLLAVVGSGLMETAQGILQLI